MMTEIKGAVCLIRGSQDTGTGFIGRMELNGEFTFVLMTNNHIFGDEKTAKGSSIEFQFLPHQPIYLSELIEEGQFFWTNTTEELDFSIVKINGEKLEEKLRKKDKSIIPINLCAPASIKTGDYIRIIQHPHGGELSMSMSTCKVLDALLLYESGTHPGSSGSPVLKEINGMLVIVALHRGGREVGPNKDIKIGYNYATLFSEIQNCVSGKDYKKKPKVKKIQEFLDECESK
ncbi:uncharacterized protein [Dysidea avara]|uniref:uncharacterized protein n=1 Tax=Dysidea avara TaxID=196820 RepID=UPI0033164EDC